MAEAEDLESPSQGMEFAVDPSRVLRALLVVVAFLVALSTAGQAMVHYLPDFPARDALAHFLYVDEEQSLPTLYSVVMLIASALLLAMIAHAHRYRRLPGARYWAVMSVVFAFLAVDEFASVHELSTDPIRALLDIGGGPLWFAWVIPAAVAVAVIAIASLRFIRYLPQPTGRRLWVAGTLFVSGAVGLEAIGGAYATDHGQADMAYALIATAEETLEMVGVVVLVYALLAYIPSAYKAPSGDYESPTTSRSSVVPRGPLR